MDFSAIFQLREKKFWWMDVIFYFVIALLLAVVLCYVIFSIKNVLQQQDIQKEITALKTVGTDDQKLQEKQVIDYRKKINDFTAIFKSHEFASNVFAFLQKQTMPNTWFKQFLMNEQDASVQLSGESDNMEAFSRQVATFEKNEYVKNITVLNSSLGNSARIQFSLGVSLDPKIFGYIAASATPSSSVTGAITASLQNPLTVPITTTTTPESSPIVQGGQTASQTAQTPSQTTPSANPIKSNQNLITVFHILLHPDAIGVVDQTNHTISVNVPYGTDITNLIPAIVISPNAIVLPGSNISENFSNTVTYSVIAEDGSRQNYEVTVHILPQVVAVQKPQSGISRSLFFMIIMSLSVIVIAVALFIAIKILFKKRPGTI